jgi:signal transduction histidine kinase
VLARLNRDLLDPRTYGSIAYLLAAGVLGTAEFVFLVTAISTGVGLAVTLVGIPILIVSVYAWGWLAEVERRVIHALTGRRIANPYRPLPKGGWWVRLRARLADPATWKDLVFLLLQFPIGLASFIVACVVLGVGVGGLTLPLWYWSISGGPQFGVVTVDTLPEALACAPVGALVLYLGIPALGALGRLYGAYAEVLLGSNADPALTAEVSDLRDARSRIIEAADAERRRIERDLHDGAQQRLVALALTLRMAEKRAAEGDPESSELVRKASDEAGLALKDLRDLARGIHPAILTNRGLTAALEDLAGRASIPVRIVEAPRERFPDPVEATAYFVVSECLANVDKHAEATSATIAVRAEDDKLVVEVGDDGVGGAELAGGSGLQGLEDRVGALDGTLSVESAPGGGTLVRASIPLAEPDEVTHELPTDDWGPVLTDAQAAAVQTHRVHRLRARLGVVGIVSATLLAIWALTGAPNAWVAFPLLALAMLAGLDAWTVLGVPPLRQSDLARAPSARAARRRRGLRRTAGILAIVDLYLIGLWVVGDRGYFWPAWVLLGSAVALGLKALPHPVSSGHDFAGTGV